MLKALFVFSIPKWLVELYTDPVNLGFNQRLMMNYINHLPLQFEKGIEEEEKPKHKARRITIKNPYSKSSKDNKGDIGQQTPPLSNELKPKEDEGDIEPQTPPLSNELKPKEDEWKTTERRSQRAGEIESREKFHSTIRI